MISAVMVMLLKKYYGDDDLIFKKCQLSKNFSPGLMAAQQWNRCCYGVPK